MKQVLCIVLLFSFFGITSLRAQNEAQDNKRSFTRPILPTLERAFDPAARTSAACPTSPVSMGGQDATTGAAISNGATIACGGNQFYVFPNNTTANMAGPCIETEYSIYYTSLSTKGSETFYEGGVNIGCVGPSSSCSFPIGGTVPPVSGVQGWDLYLSYLDPNQQHDFVFCRSGSISSTTVQLLDCWSGAALSPVTPFSNTNPPNTSTCFTLTVPAGTDIGTYTFSILPVSASAALSDQLYGVAVVDPALLSAGTYTVNYAFTPSTSSGCGTVNGTFVFTIGPNPTVSVNSPSMCSGGAGQTLTATGTANTYSWTPSTGLSATTGTTVTATPTTTTIYTVTGTKGGCTTTGTSTVTVIPTPTVTASASPTAICIGQSSLLTANGASTYTWSANAGSVQTQTASVTPPVGTTVYSVTGTSSGCNNTATTTVTVNALPTVTATSNTTTICSSQSATLTAGGASTYTWSPNEGGSSNNPTTVSPGSTDTYTVTGTDANGCVNTAQVTINVTPTPTITTGANPTTICAGQTATLTVSGATTYTWDANAGNSTATSVNVTPANSTTYTVIGDNSGCTTTGTVAVSVTPLPTLTVTANPGNICTGQSSTITAAGATTYTWSANAGGGNANPVTVTPGANTTYTVAGTQNGCTDSTTVSVNVGAPPSLSISATDTTICVGQTTTLTATGANNYTWTPGSTGNTSAQSPVTTTTVSLVGDNNGCRDSITFVINVNPTPTVSAVASPTAICSGDSSTLTASGATTYTWSANANSAQTSTVNVTPGTTGNITYSVTGTDNNGCTGTAQVTVSVTATPVLLAIASPTNVCAGQSTNLVANGSATSYSWSTGATTQFTSATPTVNPTTYTVTGFFGACSSFTTVTVGVTPQPTVSAITATSFTTCSGAADTLNVTVSPGNATIQWSPGGASTTSVIVNPTTTTTYSVLATVGTCTAQSAPFTVTVTPTPQFTATATGSQAVCAGGTVQGISFNTSSGATVNWTNTNTNIGLAASGSGSINSYTAPNVTTSQTGTITATATNNGCIGNTQDFTITINPNPVITGSPTFDSSLCGKPTGAILGLTASGGTGSLTYQWSSGGVPVGSSANLTNMLGGSYVLTVTDANLCTAQSTAYTIGASPGVLASISAAPTAGTATLNVSFTGNTTGATSWNWNFGNGSTATTQNPTGVYPVGGDYVAMLTASNAFGCSATDTVHIHVDQAIMLIVPNIFSPNGDNINDEFSFTAMGITNLTCDIFNRWGQKVKTLSGPTAKWDGKLDNGNTATEGTYFYTVVASSYDGKPHNSQGTITLVR